MKWKYLVWISLMIVVTCINGCQKDDDLKSKQYSVTGLVQKGPFINGTSISLQELTASLSQTGKNFATQVNDNTGSFGIDDITLVSSYVYLTASGYYFDEVKGSISSTTLDLGAISDISNLETVNVNLLTHLEKSRVEYLVDQASSFSDAKTTAQTEVLAAFGLSPGQLNNSELLNISSNDNGGAVLLAVSVILQGNRSVGELSELLAEMTNDIKEDGTLDNATLNSLRSSTKVLDLANIRSNLEQRYDDLGSTVSIPDFESYVNSFLAFTGEPPVSSTAAATDIGGFSVTLNGTVLANSLPTTVSFEYGITTAYGDTIASTPGVVNGLTDVAVGAQLTGLQAAKTYHYRIKSKNAKGVVYGDDLTFTTLGGTAIVSTTGATDTQETNSTINGIINPNYLSTTVTFEYGTTTSYGNSISVSASPFTGNSDIRVSATLTGLTMGQTYHFRIKAENEAGTVTGNDSTLVPFHPIGSAYGGGLLAYVLLPGNPGYDANNVHGLIVSTEDLGPHAWLDSAALITWRDNHGWISDYSNPDLGIGKVLTETLIVKYGSNLTGPSAAALCYNLVFNGYDDWFLPSADELAMLNANPSAFGLKTATDDSYWSSTAVFCICHSQWSAYCYSYSGAGSLTIVAKTTRKWVRPMRYF
jgi:hypothetical protein